MLLDFILVGCAVVDFVGHLAVLLGLLRRKFSTTCKPSHAIQGRAEKALPGGMDIEVWMRVS